MIAQIKDGSIKTQAEPIEAQEQPKKALEIDYQTDEGFIAYKNSVFHDLTKEKTSIKNRYENETKNFIVVATKFQEEFNGYQDKKNRCKSMIDELKEENKKFFIRSSTKSHNEWRISELEKDLGSANYFMEKLTKENGKYLNVKIDDYKKTMADKLSTEISKHDEKAKQIANYDSLVKSYEDYKTQPITQKQEAPSESIKQGFQRALSEVRQQSKAREDAKQSVRIKNDGWSMDR